jgi:C4-dicarboxylate transporter, DctM subunit
MSPETVGVIGIAAVLLLTGSGMWIGFAMGTVGLAGFWYLSGTSATVKLMATVPYNTLSDYILAMVPLFILMGVVAGNAGIAGDLYKAANTWVGHLRGGLGLGTTLACALFGAISGASLVEIISIGRVAIPEMQKLNYSTELASGTVAAAGVLDVLIPPSLAFVIYGILTDTSVAQLLMAGILPGILMTVLFIITIAIIGWRNPSSCPPGPKTTWREKLVSLKYVWATVLLFVLIIGGIYGGVFTATEAGGIGAFGAIVIAVVSRRINVRSFLDSCVETVKNVGMFAVLMSGAYILMKFLAISNLPFALADFIAGLSVNRYIILTAIIVMYILLGMFFDVMAAIILTIPILLPAIVTMGFDPIWFGVIMVILMEMAGITPPFGFSVFVLSGVTKIPAAKIFKGAWPFVVAEVVCIVILVAFPAIALLIPGGM